MNLDLLGQKRNSRTVKICLGALFAAMTAACTFISVPLPFGYFNLGDAVILLSAFLLGPLACISAAVGAALADVLMGFAIYAPATAMIKAGCAAIAFFVSLAVLGRKRRGKGKRIVAALIGGIAAETFMVLGYLAYEALVLGYGAAALASVLGNVTQGVCGVVASTAIYALISRFERK